MVDKSYEKGSWNQQFQESLETREALYKKYDVPKSFSDQIFDNMWGK